MERMDLSGHAGEVQSPVTSKYAGAHGHSLSNDTPSLHPSSNGPPRLPPLSTTTPEAQQPTAHSTKKGGAVVRYRECLKNHAASIGGNATDGCGEFMPSGEEGTLEALKCSACSCHRNFHRKEIEGQCRHHHHHLKETKSVGHKVVLISGAETFGYSNPATHCLIPSPLPHQMVMPLGALMASESDEMEGAGGARAPPMGKKRLRTRFAPEQKEKMLSFAERIGWRLQRQEESVVEEFCQEIGVKRKVLKVWMHNNKHSLAKQELPPA
ncbi:zinc-finger homeodomain protein 4-like [Phoenix dactylifera]|uniref:Zinc-finger homeodomain protein 4-like n=1 Tax=Phoenix dactylifera TaxID=42345 RepID=A0A8B8J3R4_PHODC|nr:zinc-finger homeodomain protein 4-like [Phoenix dactylifera]